MLVRGAATDTKTCPSSMHLGRQALLIVLAASFMVLFLLGPQWSDAGRTPIKALAGDRLGLFHSVLVPRDLTSGVVVKVAINSCGNGGPLPSPVDPVAPAEGSGLVAVGPVVRAAPTDRPTRVWPRAPPSHASTTASL